MSGSTQTISTAVTGPVFSNGGAIAITSSGSISKGREGVFAKNFSITTLSNKGSIGAATRRSGRRWRHWGADQLGPDHQPSDQRERRDDQRRKRRRRRRQPAARAARACRTPGRSRR